MIPLCARWPVRAHYGLIILEAKFAAKVVLRLLSKLRVKGLLPSRLVGEQPLHQSLSRRPIDEFLQSFRVSYLHPKDHEATQRRSERPSRTGACKQSLRFALSRSVAHACRDQSTTLLATAKYGFVRGH